jgi:hypothetical protein
MLDSRLALKIAARLTVVKEFPRHQEAIDAVAEDLMDLTLECDELEAERRSRAVVEEIRRTWTEWTGESELIGLYRKHWPVPREVLSTDNQIKSYGSKPPIECRICNDTGVFKPEGEELYRWCECDAGIMLHFDLPDWLQLCNAQPPEKPPEPTEAELMQPLIARLARPVSEEIEKALRCVEDCSACLEGRRHTHSEYSNHHTKQEIAS